MRLRGQAGIHRKHHEDLKRQMTTKEKDLTDKMELNKRKQEKIDALLKDKESNEKVNSDAYIACMQDALLPAIDDRVASQMLAFLPLPFFIVDALWRARTNDVG